MLLFFQTHKNFITVLLLYLPLQTQNQFPAKYFTGISSLEGEGRLLLGWRATPEGEIHTSAPPTSSKASPEELTQKQELKEGGVQLKAFRDTISNFSSSWLLQPPFVRPGFAKLQ